MERSHLGPEELAFVAVSGGPEPGHAAECAACRADLAELRRIVGDLRTLPQPPERLIEEAKAFYVRRRRLEEIVERMASDPAFRAKAIARPEAILREAGLAPVPELIEALRSVEAGSSRELEQRLAAKRLWF
jgi:hypothetical protein